MPLMTHWIGGKSLKTGSKISAVVVVVALSVELIVAIYSIVRLHGLKISFTANMQRSFFPPGVLPLAYVKLVLTLIGITLSSLLIYWTSKGYEAIYHMWIWCCTLSVIRCIELIFGIYMMAWIGGDNLRIIMVIGPELVVFAAFWIAFSLVLILCILGVISYCEEVKLGYRRGVKDSSSRPLHGNVQEKTVQARVIGSTKPNSKKPQEPAKPKKPRLYLKKGETREVGYESGV